jgi:hypothetical protein
MPLVSKRPKVVSPVHILFSSKSKQTTIFGAFFLPKFDEMPRSIFQVSILTQGT